MKYEPKVGDHLYLRQYTNNCWVNEVKRPYTVIEARDNVCIVQACKLIFHGPVYYDTIADDIVENPEGRKVKLRWSEKKHRWQESPADSYPLVAVFGKWEHQPYLD